MLTKEKQEFKLSPIKVIVLSFLMIIIVGTILLTLPISSKTGMPTSLIDALFTATSATCVTGLVVVDTFNHWSYFGQIVILGLIQVGGLGLVTFTTFFIHAMGKRMGFKTMQLAQESISFSGMSNIGDVVKKVVLWALIFELIGAILLSTVFVPKYGANGVFISVFLAISAFCNAGFDILGFETPYASLINYSDNIIVVGTISLLIVIGGLGFLVWHDIYMFKKNKRLLLHTKIVLFTTLILIVVGGLLVTFEEWNNQDTIAHMPVWQKFLNGFFHSVSTRTAGFNTVDMNSLETSTKALSICLMFIGASPGSTGGGIKTTTIGVIIMTVVCVIMDKKDTIILKRKVSSVTVYKAISVFCVSVFIVMSLFVILVEFNPVTGVTSYVNYMFESVSAISTVGLSVGVTGTMNTLTKFFTLVTMFIGRVGVLSLFIAIFNNNSNGNKSIKVNPEGIVVV